MSIRSIAARNILIVDDEPSVSNTLKMLLTFDGHRVETAPSGQVALEMFSPGKYDLVITDYLMPQMKGDALAAQFKSRAPTQPIILMSAYPDTVVTADSPLTGVDRVVCKPFQLAELRSAIADTTSSTKP